MPVGEGDLFRHPSHEHYLVRNIYFPERSGSDCDNRKCRKSVYGVAYSCLECNFDICETCFSLPSRDCEGGDLETDLAESKEESLARINNRNEEEWRMDGVNNEPVPTIFVGPNAIRLMQVQILERAREIDTHGSREEKLSFLDETERREYWSECYTSEYSDIRRIFNHWKNLYREEGKEEKEREEKVKPSDNNSQQNSFT